MNRPPLLSISGLEAGYGKKQILFGVDAHVSAGEILGIVGPNGSGKSTFLKAVFGLVRPSAGDVRYADRSITAWGPRRKLEEGLAIVVQGAQAFDELSVEDNLLLGGQAVLSRRDARARVRELEERFPILGERRRELARRLSGGERQQLALARALISSPKVLLLDEPSLGLAPTLVTALFKQIERLRAEGLAVAVVEQNVQAALRSVDRVLVLREGRAVLAARPEEFRASADLAHAFLGSAS
jgi:branched-chain amino acid transport system ATP-binding protein